jgi:predicted amidohydrolase
MGAHSLFSRGPLSLWMTMVGNAMSRQNCQLPSVGKRWMRTCRTDSYARSIGRTTCPFVSQCVGTLDCIDICRYAVRTFYYSQGTQIYCAPTVDARPAWQHTMAHIALEGRCFVLSACQFSQESDYPPDHPVRDVNNRSSENVMIGGGSVIISPLGEVGDLLQAHAWNTL